ncbi:MAG: FkbM family methyltransferase [Deltaproteobacteria bacterium]|nr:FkbM family methyltransferase [Deltaproteobacteria bacterium]
MRLNLNEKSQRHLYFSKIYEPEITLKLPLILNPGDCFIDVGAHHGYYSLATSSLVGPTGKVLSLEADPRNYESLKRNLQENRFDNILALNIGISNQTGTATFHRNPLNDGGGSLQRWERYVDRNRSFSKDLIQRKFSVKTEIQVETKDMSSLLLHLKKDTFLTLAEDTVVKIDVEGYEVEVVEGMLSLLNTNGWRPKALIIECSNKKEGIIHDRLQPFGYVASYPDRRGRLLRPRENCKYYNKMNVFFILPEQINPKLLDPKFLSRH